MKTIPTQTENPKGLHQRYHIMKLAPTPEDSLNMIPTDAGSEYFVMRLDLGGSDLEHIKACRIGINAYADAIANHLPELSKDLKERYPLIEPINKVNDVEGKNLKCEGSCEEHNGIVRKVKVIGLGFEDGMDFNYCEEAIKEDLRRGFLVEIL